MDPEMMIRVEECIHMTQQLTSRFSNNQSDISQCVGERVALQYKKVTEQMLSTTEKIRKNLYLLQQMQSL